MTIKIQFKEDVKQKATVTLLGCNISKCLCAKIIVENQLI